MHSWEYEEILSWNKDRYRLIKMHLSYAEKYILERRWKYHISPSSLFWVLQINLITCHPRKGLCANMLSMISSVNVRENCKEKERWNTRFHDLMTLKPIWTQWWYTFSAEVCTRYCTHFSAEVVFESRLFFQLKLCLFMAVLNDKWYEWF